MQSVAFLAVANELASALRMHTPIDVSWRKKGWREGRGRGGQLPPRQPLRVCVDPPLQSSHLIRRALGVGADQDVVGVGVQGVDGHDLRARGQVRAAVGGGGGGGVDVGKDPGQEARGRHDGPVKRRAAHVDVKIAVADAGRAQKAVAVAAVGAGSRGAWQACATCATRRVR